MAAVTTVEDEEKKEKTPWYQVPGVRIRATKAAYADIHGDEDGGRSLAHRYVIWILLDDKTPYFTIDIIREYCRLSTDYMLTTEEGKNDPDWFRRLHDNIQVNLFTYLKLSAEQGLIERDS
jgi:hypothetical protein